MSTLPHTHDTFTIERVLKSPVARVFAAWATAEAKAKWFAGGEGWTEEIREFDFRVGGQDRLVGTFQGKFTSDYRATYHDIVPDERIVTAYDMRMDGKLISVSLATAAFRPEGSGTRITLTEQGVFVNGFEDNGSREHGTNQLMDRLEALLDGRNMAGLKV